MRNKNLLAGLYNVYVVYDKISKHYKSIHFESTDEEFIRKDLPKIIYETPLRDLQIFKIGIFNDVTGEIKPTSKKKVETDCYCFPMARLSPKGEDIPIEKLQEEILKAKNELLASVGSEENNKEEN